MPKASGIITRAESSTSASVLTTLSETCPHTGCWLASEVPGSPVSSPPSQSKYLVMRESPTPSWASSCSRRATLES